MSKPDNHKELSVISEILEEWLDDAMATSSMGVTIDDNRTEDDRDRQYIEALEKHSRRIDQYYADFYRNKIPEKKKVKGYNELAGYSHFARGYNQAINDITTQFNRGDNDE